MQKTIHFNLESDYISHAELARRAGVTHAAITHACKKNLQPAVQGNKIDAAHELVIEYINKRKRGDNDHVRGHQAKKETQKQEQESQAIEVEIPENITIFVDMSLREIIEKFGTDIRFVDWLRATKSIEDINEKRLKNAITEGKLIDRELVKNFIIDPINSMHTKLLGAGSKTLSIRLKSKIDAGCTILEIETFISEYIESFINPMKNKIIKSLKNA